jgi:hypothetical protein
MFLVELRPGKEELYRSADDLALAIRNGDVDTRSRIYHRATAKWISITLHPQYKAIIADKTEEPQPTRPARRGWGILGGGSSPQPPGASSHSDPSASPGAVLHRWKRPIGLGLSALLLVSGIQLAFTGPRPPWSQQNRPVATRPVRRPAAKPVVAATPIAPRQELVSLASTTTVWPSTPTAVADTATAPTPELVLPGIPRAPRLRPKVLGQALQSPTTSVKVNSVEGLLKRYSEAHDSARTRLEAGLRVARLDRLFAAPRLAPGGGVSDTRLSLAGAANFIRVFRQQQNAIEEAYQDTVTSMAKNYGWTPTQVRQWYSRAPRKEPPTLELLSSSLMNGIDSLLGVLDDQAGAYKLRGGAIAFEDPAASQRYGALRRSIKDRIDSAVAAGGPTSPGATRLLLQAIGTSTLPRET